MKRVFGTVGFGVGLLTALLTHCDGAAWTQVNLRTVIDDGGSNELRAVAKYGDQRLIVNARLKSVGLKKQTELRGSASSVGVGFKTQGQTQTREVNVQYPYAVLTPGDGRTGFALCFFSPDDVQEAAQLRPGGPVKLSGRFQEFMRVKGETVLVLNACSVE
jgi:hypothetical protein